MNAKRRAGHKERPAEVLQRKAREVGCALGSLGDTEQLAGVDVRSEVERAALWNQFSTLFTGPTQALFDAVMDHCAAIALARIERGELCLLPTH
jgi:hypothetical protein